MKNKNNRLIFISGIVIILIIVGFFVIKPLFSAKKEDLTNYDVSNNINTLSVVKDDNGIPKFIDGDFANIKIKSEDDVFAALENIKDDLKVKNVKDEFVIDDTEVSEDITYYRLNQVYKGVLVYNNDLILSVNSSGKILSLSGHYIPNISIDINEKLTKEELENIAKEDLGNNATIYESKKYIYADNLNQNLVYVIIGYSDESVKEYIIDANSGEIIISSDLYSYADAYEFTGYGIDDKLETVTIEEYYEITALKNRYRLIDPNRNIQIVDSRDVGMDLFGVISTGLFSSSTPMVGDIDGYNFKYLADTNETREFAKSAITTLKNFEEIYDYYLNVLGRNSYDNKGGKILVNIGLKESTFGKEKAANASWLKLNNQMYIGYWNDIPFGISKDVLAHEITHGVINEITKFASSPKKEDKNKAFETGALDEGIADIFGNLIEGENWTINESIETMRSASNPNQYKNPSQKGGEYYYPDGMLGSNGTIEELLKQNNLESVYSYDKGGIHNNSTVVSHAAYLMYENGAFKSRKEMAKVWYNALFLMSSYSDFEDCALAVIKAASNLKLSAEKIEIIRDAFIETKMIEDSKVELRGIVSSGDVKLENVKVEISNVENNRVVYEIITDSNGKFSQKIASGVYEIKFSKDDFSSLEKKVNVYNDTDVNVSLASIKKQNSTSNNLNCKSDNCHKVTICFLESDNINKLDQAYETYEVEDGTIIGTDFIIDSANSYFGSNAVSSNGDSFKVTTSGYTIDFGWYYKGTNNKFDFNEPITEDIEIEMKMMDGLIDDDFIKNIYDILK